MFDAPGAFKSKPKPVDPTVELSLIITLSLIILFLINYF